MFGRFLIASWESTIEELDARSRIPPRLQNTDGEALLFTTDHFTLEPGKRAEVEARLRAVDGVEPPRGGQRELLHLRAGREGHVQDHRDDGGGQGLGLEQTLKLGANSIARADALRQRIEDACPGLLHHRARKHSDPIALMDDFAPEEMETEAPDSDSCGCCGR